MIDRFRGCLLGGAIGDALGAPVEFYSLDQIRARFGGPITDYAPAYGRQRGAVTDDTQMTLFTAEGIIRAKMRMDDRWLANVPDVLQRAYLRWLHTQAEVPDWEAVHWYPDREPSGWLVTNQWLSDRRSPGNTCLAALRSPSDARKPAPNDSKGCGGVMRAAPIGLAFWNDPGEAFGMGQTSAWITHGHDHGYLAAGFLARIISMICAGTDLEVAVTRFGPQAPGGFDPAGPALRARSKKPATPETVELLGEGWVADEALTIAIYCALVADDFLGGISLAASHTGDSDSTASITGSILGALWGVDALPGNLLEDLEGVETIDRVARDMYAVFVDSSGADMDDIRRRYPGS